MAYTLIRDLYTHRPEADLEHVKVSGWVRTIRESKAFAFVELNDGTYFKNLQIIMEADKLEDYLASLPGSVDYLRKLFQKEFGVTPHQYLNNKRLQIAAETLVNCSDTIADIAVMCGFRDPLYFSRMFKKKYGVSPSHYVRTKQDAEPPAPEEPQD